MRVKVDYRTTSREVYEKFISVHPNINISFKDWQEVIFAFNREFRDYILETGDRIKLPRGFGPFSISKKKSTTKVVVNGETYITLPVDWVKTKLLGKKTYFLNAHTDGYRYKWMWFPKEAKFFMSEFWIFKPARETSRKLSEYLKKPNSIFSQIYKKWK